MGKTGAMATVFAVATLCSVSRIMGTTLTNPLLQVDLDRQPWLLRTSSLQQWVSQGFKNTTFHDVSPQRSLLTAVQSVAIDPSKLCTCQLGNWCSNFMAQAPMPFKAAPRGNKTCPKDCSQQGSCNYDTGMCYCSAGYTGEDCSAPRKRPCHRMAADKRDAGWNSEPQEWAHTRCTGVCDDNYAQCWCPPEFKYGRVPAPEGSPLGTPPIRHGREMYMCYALTTATGETVKWAPPFMGLPYEKLFGEQGWCQADVPPQDNRCPCRLDGMAGLLCDIPIEHMCPNQCSARGQCIYGFCNCHNGWYGNDCSRKRKGLEIEPDDIASGAKPFLAEAVTPVAAALDPAVAAPTRKRPFVFVYDIGTEYMSELLQWRGYRGVCHYRSFDERNGTELKFYSYSMEPVLHELFLTTEHRTFDPEEADYFYVPHYGTCLFDFYGNNKVPMWPPGSHGVRPMGTANMLLGAQKWISQKFPYFNRTGGADHIWLMAHDEGACYAPIDIWPGVILTPWGRMDMPHTHQTSYGPDWYSKEHIDKQQPDGWLNYTSQAHPCYDPVKDLVLPVFKDPTHYETTIYLGGKQPARDVLFFFRGDMGEGKMEELQGCLYSRCIRQRLLNLSRTQEWDKHNVLYGRNIPGSYSLLLLRSIFCLVLPGDGWSARWPDAMLHGCIPVIIMDNTHGPFENVLDYSQFSIRHPENALPTLLSTLQAVSPERIKELQANVHKVWQRFRFNGLTAIDNAARAFAQRHQHSETSHPGAEFALSRQEDAFATLMQFLHSRIPHTRGPKGTASGAATSAAEAMPTAVAPSSAITASTPAGTVVVPTVAGTTGAVPVEVPAVRSDAEDNNEATALLAKAAAAAIAAATPEGKAAARARSQQLEAQERAVWEAKEAAAAKDVAAQDAAAAAAKAASEAKAAEALAAAKHIEAAESEKIEAMKAAAEAEKAAEAKKAAEAARVIEVEKQRVAVQAKVVARRERQAQAAKARAAEARRLEAAKEAAEAKEAGSAKVAAAHNSPLRSAETNDPAAGAAAKQARRSGQAERSGFREAPSVLLAAETPRSDAFVHNRLTATQMMLSMIYALGLLAALLSVMLVLVLRYPWLGQLLGTGWGLSRDKRS